MILKEKLIPIHASNSTKGKILKLKNTYKKNITQSHFDENRSRLLKDYLQAEMNELN